MYYNAGYCCALPLLLLKRTLSIMMMICLFVLNILLMIYDYIF